MSGQKFYHDWEHDVYYLVNFQENVYMKIAEKGSLYYKLCQRLYCGNWNIAKTFISTFRQVDRLEQIDGSEY